MDNTVLTYVYIVVGRTRNFATLCVCVYGANTGKICMLSNTCNTPFLTTLVTYMMYTKQKKIER